MAGPEIAAVLLVLLCALAPSVGQQSARSNKTRGRVQLVCPDFAARQTTFLTLPCARPADCLFGDLCCPTKPGSRKSRCFKGVPKPLSEQEHELLFGVVPQACPNPPVSEILPVTKCANDTECWPRLCCPDGRERFCRTPAPHWERIPQNQLQPVLQALRSAMKYLQCSAPPEPIFDLFPRACQFPRDCFPDLCCQEGPRKVCRRPQRSLLALLSSLTPTTPVPVKSTPIGSKSAATLARANLTPSDQKVNGATQVTGKQNQSSTKSPRKTKSKQTTPRTNDPTQLNF